MTNVSLSDELQTALTAESLQASAPTVGASADGRAPLRRFSSNDYLDGGTPGIVEDLALVWRSGAQALGTSPLSGRTYTIETLA